MLEARDFSPRIAPGPGPVKVIAVTGGKGGVGKTTVTANLAVSLAARGREVMVLDADLGLANLDVMLGLQSRYNLSHVLAGERSLDEVLVEGPGGIQIIPASSGVRRMVNLSALEKAGLIRAFSDLRRHVDVLLLDMAAGIHEDVLMFSRAAHHVLVVVCDEPASLTDAYALIKVLSRDMGVSRFRILANQTRALGEGRDLYDKLLKVCDRFLDVTLDYAGAVPQDDFVRRSIQRQKAVAELYPGSLGGQSFKKLAATADSWGNPVGASGHLEFFVERLVLGRPGVSSLQ